MSKRLGSFWIVAIGRGLQILLGMLSLRVLSTLLPTQELGYLYLITSITTWFSLVLMNPVGMFANRKSNQWSQDGHLVLAMSALLFYSAVLALVSIPVVLSLDRIFDFSHGNSLLLALSVTLQIGVVGFGTTVLSLLNLTRSRAVYIPVAVFVQFLGLLTAVVLVKWLSPAAWLWLLGTAVANIFAALIVFWIASKRPARLKVTLRGFVRPQLKELKVFALPVLLATLLMWAQTQGYRFFIEAWLGRESLARLAIGLGAALSIFASLEGFVAQYFFPDLYRSMDGLDAKTKKQSWNLLIEQIYSSYFLVFFACLIASPYILRILLAAQYQDLTLVFALGIVIEMCRVMTNVANLGTHSEWSPRKSLVAYLVGLTVTAAGLTIQYLFSDGRLWLIAMILTMGGIATFAVMWRQVRRLISLRFPLGPGVKAAALMSPLLILHFWTDTSLLPTLTKLSLTGIWTLFLMLEVQAGSGLHLRRFRVWAGLR